jgi:hypothetical protein
MAVFNTWSESLDSSLVSLDSSLVRLHYGCRPHLERVWVEVLEKVTVLVIFAGEGGLEEPIVLPYLY